MSRTSDAANAMVYAVEQVCDLYRVQYTREQSRAINMEGTAGRWRPMFFGSWTDSLGKVHRAGKADLLARPKIKIAMAVSDSTGTISIVNGSVPLWIECKTGDGRMTPDQRAFQSWVQSNGDFFLLLHDDVRPLIAWFEAHGVERHASDAAVKAVLNPPPMGELYKLPCRHCGLVRDKHVGACFGCPGKRGTVWSPNLKAI